MELLPNSKKFRETNLVVQNYKKFVSRKVRRKILRSAKIFLSLFWKNFVKATDLPDLLQKLLNSWFDEIFFGESKFLTFLQSAIVHYVTWFDGKMLIFFTLCDFNENFVKSHFYCVLYIKLISRNIFQMKINLL